MPINRIFGWILLAALALGAGAAVAAMPWEAAGAPALALFVFGGLALLLAFADTVSEERPFVAALFLTALGVRLLAAAVYALATGGEARFLLNDAVAYERVGWFLAQSAHGSLPPGEGLGNLAWLASYTFPNILAAIYGIVGRSPAVIVVCNSVLGAATVYIAYRLSSLILGPVTARLAGWLIALYSGLWIFSLMPLKDALILFLVMLSFLSFYRFWIILVSGLYAGKEILSGALWLTLFSASLAAEYFLRDYTLIPQVTALAVLPVIWMIRTWKWRGVGAVALLLVVVAWIAAPSIARMTISQAAVEAGSPILDLATPPPGGKLTDVFAWLMVHPVEFIRYLLVASAATLIAPFAWMIPGWVPDAAPFGPMTVAYPGMWMWYALIPFSAFGLISAIRHSKGDALPLIVFAVLMFMVVAILIPRESRHRDLIMPVALILAAEGLIFSRRTWRIGVLFWIPLLAFMAWKVDQLSGFLALGAILAVVLVLVLLARRSHRASVG